MATRFIRKGGRVIPIHEAGSSSKPIPGQKLAQKGNKTAVSGLGAGLVGVGASKASRTFQVASSRLGKNALEYARTAHGFKSLGNMETYGTLRGAARESAKASLRAGKIAGGLHKSALPLMVAGAGAYAVGLGMAAAGSRKMSKYMKGKRQ